MHTLRGGKCVYMVNTQTGVFLSQSLYRCRDGLMRIIIYISGKGDHKSVSHHDIKVI